MCTPCTRSPCESASRPEVMPPRHSLTVAPHPGPLAATSSRSPGLSWWSPPSPCWTPGRVTGTFGPAPRTPRERRPQQEWPRAAPAARPPVPWGMSTWWCTTATPRRARCCTTTSCGWRRRRWTERAPRRRAGRTTTRPRWVNELETPSQLQTGSWGCPPGSSSAGKDETLRKSGAAA